jgi:hypothetical protein
MSILDDIFTFGAANFSPANKVTVSVNASVTTNKTDGLQTQSNAATATNDLHLNYSPSTTRTVEGLRHEFPASYQGTGVTISAAPLRFPPAGGNYTLSWNGSADVPLSVDATSNIVYAVSGTTFITVSLCDQEALQGTQ